MTDIVIVLGPPRSYTSVVSAMIGQHPQLYGLPEVHLFTTDTVAELLYFYKLAGRRRADGLLRSIAELFMKKQTPDAVKLATQWVFKNKDLSTAEVLQRLISKIQPKIAVEKSVSTIWRPRHLERVAEQFPDARYIHLTRHPRPQCESMLEAVENEDHIRKQCMDNSTNPPTLDPQVLWLQLHGNIVRFLENIPAERQLRVHGEDVLTDTDNQLVHMCEWLQIRTDEEAIEEMKHPERSPYSVLGPPNAPFGNDPKFIKEPALRPTKVRPQSLEGLLSWRSDVPGFSADVTELARRLGYE